MPWSTSAATRSEERREGKEARSGRRRGRERRRRHTIVQGDWSSDVCSSDLYDDLVREQKPRRAQPQPKRKPETKAAAVAKAPPSTSTGDKEQEALELVLETIDALVDERGDEIGRAS